MPSSKIEWVQEMGRCGRVDGEDITRHDEYMLVLQLENYVYLNERLFIEKEKGEVKDDLTSEERELEKNAICKRRKQDKKALMEVIEMICLLRSCWHRHLEHTCANPNDPEEVLLNTANCDLACPNCDGSLYKLLVPVLRKGMRGFLTKCFIEIQDELTPIQLAKKLYVYPNVGKVVFNRPKSLKAESLSHCKMIIMELLAAKLIYLSIKVESKPRAICKLHIEDDVPYYLIQNSWEKVLLHDQ